MAELSEKITNFLHEQIAQADLKAKAYVFDEKNDKKLQRNIFVKMEAYLKSFLAGSTKIRWVTLTGLRGAGKTTLLSQLFHSVRNGDYYKLFISLDQTSQILGASLDEVISAYEDIIGKSLEALDKPLLLFLDEVQYDEKWGIVLKSIYDRSNKVFVFATGSAALLMNSNTDIARRTVFEKLFPLSFSEYLKVKNYKFESKGLSKEIRTALFFSNRAQDVYAALKSLERKANQYYLGITRHEFSKYLEYGSLPFMMVSENESIIYDQISKILDKVVSGDIASIGRFSSEIISKIPGILYAVADMDAFNFSTVSNSFGISRPKVVEIFNLLEQTEILHRIYPHGSHLNQAAKKPSKYLFSAPAFRAMYYKILGNTISAENAQGKLLEDLVGMYLHRIFYREHGVSLTYDSAQGGADFILGTGGQKIVIEVGAGEKGYRQVAATAKKVKPKFGLIISNNQNNTLEYSEEFNTVKVPLRLFLLA
ncbi:AAA family ATPase [Candidatus Gracilibacteria bacterium]|nr:AAA family ATPase [Candidatus Gracilibacteria bacterium]MCF7856379.1 AAA family ATPase [Candidatus Gracilibacteria bacterium]MCF7896825.1 AAA family ATPase [Candidatus Gracilibacteria bacterium]